MHCSATQTTHNYYHLHLIKLKGEERYDTMVRDQRLVAKRDDEEGKERRERRRSQKRREESIDDDETHGGSRV